MARNDQYSRYTAQHSVSTKPKKRHRFLKVLVVLVVIVAIGFAMFPTIERMYYKLDYEEYIQEAADTYKVNPYWIAAMIKCESDFDPEAVSSAGAIGLMQMMPSTADWVSQKGLVDSSIYDPDNLTDPETNINYGTAYLRYLVERYHEMNPAIAAYNAGISNVDEWLQEDEDVRKSVTFSETEKYIKAVNRAKEKYEELYPDAFTVN
ncbi:MAG: lytic transglycosylase domain-containing protein [Coriobacteriales bacterium]